MQLPTEAEEGVRSLCAGVIGSCPRWVLGTEPLSGRAVHALNCRVIFSVLSCYAEYTFISFGYCDTQNFALKTFVAGITPVNMYYCVLKRTLQM